MLAWAGTSGIESSLFGCPSRSGTWATRKRPLGRTWTGATGAHSCGVYSGAQKDCTRCMHDYFKYSIVSQPE